MIYPTINTSGNLSMHMSKLSTEHLALYITPPPTKNQINITYNFCFTSNSFFLFACKAHELLNPNLEQPKTTKDDHTSDNWGAKEPKEFKLGISAAKNKETFTCSPFFPASFLL
jgi:hypothetical protein